MSRITIREVAKAAGVSIATVSNVINGRLSKVNSETAERIHQIAQKLGYQRDMNAASLKRGISNMVWVLMPEDHSTHGLALQHSPFFSDFLVGIEKGAADSDLYFSFMRVKSADELQRLSHGPAPKAVIIIGIFPQAILEQIATWPFQTIIVDNRQLQHQFPASTHFHYLNNEDVKMGQMALEYLLSLGHQNVVVLAGPMQLSVVYRDRWLGIEAAAANHQSHLSVIECHCELEAASEVFPKVHAELKRGATAVLAMSDVQALGCYRAANQVGLTIPDAFSLIGMDNLTLLNYLPFDLTTINQNIVQRGYQVVMQLTEQSLEPLQMPELITGETCRPLNSNEQQVNSQLTG